MCSESNWSMFRTTTHTTHLIDATATLRVSTDKAKRTFLSTLCRGGGLCKLDHSLKPPCIPRTLFSLFLCLFGDSFRSASQHLFISLIRCVIELLVGFLSCILLGQFGTDTLNSSGLRRILATAPTKQNKLCKLHNSAHSNMCDYRRYTPCTGYEPKRLFKYQLEYEFNVSWNP